MDSVKIRVAAAAAAVAVAGAGCNQSSRITTLNPKPVERHARALNGTYGLRNTESSPPNPLSLPSHYLCAPFAHQITSRAKCTNPPITRSDCHQIPKGLDFRFDICSSKTIMKECFLVVFSFCLLLLFHFLLVCCLIASFLSIDFTSKCEPSTIN